ncbi:MAG TPA: glycyl-radical enzyme activating protein, partial [Anaerolineales bacterium]
MTSGTIFDIKRYAINDGPGIRTAVFFKGCPLRCVWCHNPEGQVLQPQMMFRANRCKGFKDCLQVCPQGAISWRDGSITNWETCDDCGKCAEVCVSGGREMVGRVVQVQDLMAEIERDMVFYNQSGGGVTFTGGEPLMQREFLRALLACCKTLGVHTAVDTSGYATWEGLESIYPLTDLFLYDLKFADETRHKKYTSVSNNLILENLQKLSAIKANILVRIPLIPGINDDDVNIRSSATLLKYLPCLTGVELMPYHEIGLAKYQAMGMNYQLESTHPAKKEKIEEVERILAEYN